MKRALAVSLPVLGFGLLILGAYLGLVWAPPEREMGDVYRILYVHVPAAWITLLAFSLNLIASLTYLFRPSARVFGGIFAGLGLLTVAYLQVIHTAIKGTLLAALLLGAFAYGAYYTRKTLTSEWDWDALGEASAEVGVIFNGLLLCLGSIWARPTWGVWWTWDPRLTTAAIMLVEYVGYLVLRRFVNDAGRRATWSAVVGIVAYVDILLVWFSVKWWNTLHQPQSTPKTVDWQMVLALRTSAFAFLFLMIWFVRQRFLIAQSRLVEEISPPPVHA